MSNPLTRGLPPWNFDIDRYLNPLVPPPPWRFLPYRLAWWFGYRKEKPVDIGSLRVTFWAFVGSFCAIVIIQLVDLHLPSFVHHHVPIIVGSFGATAVLEFHAIDAPVAQPRNMFGGELIASVVGTAVCKLFMLSDRFHQIRWLGGALACASSIALMGLTKTVHPPAGATALLAVVDSGIVEIGWFLIPVMMLGCCLTASVALLLNNIERRYPQYWWTPDALPPYPDRLLFSRARSGEGQDWNEDGSQQADVQAEEEKTAEETPEPLAGIRDDTVETVLVRRGVISVPSHIHLTLEEMQVLEALSRRL